MDLLFSFLTLYGILAISHLLIQILFGHIEHIQQKSFFFVNFHKGHYPTVSIVVPCFNESPELLEKCLNSITMQKYDNEIHIYVVDDGSKNVKDLNPVYEKYKKLGFHIIFNDKNIGKRESQKFAFDKTASEIIITIDSDTFIEHPNGVMHIVKRFKNPNVGAVTGDVRVMNNKKNFLTRLIGYRYWTAFNQERAAQSLFNVLMCCSGPFSAYRKSVIDKVKQKYTSQYFLGQKCTYGDDRHLTNLILEEGFEVVFDNKARAYTNVPDNFKGYFKQQVRWNKSFYREMFWTFRHVTKHHIYMLYDLSMQIILPFMLIIALFVMIYQAITIDISHLYKYILILIAIAALRAIYGMYRTRDLGFIMFIIYGFMHVLFLIPIRIYAILTLENVSWGTR